MIIIGMPNQSEMKDYYMADEETAFALEQAGFHAKYMYYDVQYFKMNKKLLKKLSDLCIEV